MDISNISINKSPKHIMEIIPLRISNKDTDNNVITFFPKGRTLINRPNSLLIKPLTIKYKLKRLLALFHAFNANLIHTINPFEAYANAKWFTKIHLEYVEGIELYEDKSILTDYCLCVDDPNESIDNLFVVPSQKFLRNEYLKHSPDFCDEIRYIESTGTDHFYFLCVFKAFRFED